MRSIIFLLAMGLIAVISIIFLPIMKRSDKFLFKYVSLFERVGRFVAGNKLTIVDEEKLCREEGYLLISNHDSIFDLFNIIAVTKQTPISFMAKEELRKIPIIGKWMEYSQSEFINRENVKSQVRSISNLTKLLKNGRVIGIFPEGTRSEENLEFKAGSLKIAYKAKKAIQPMTLVNTAAVYERQGKIKSAKTYIIVHEPITYEDYKDRSVIELTKEVETLIHTTKIEYLKKIND